MTIGALNHLNLSAMMKTNNKQQAYQIRDMPKMARQLFWGNFGDTIKA